MSRSETMTNLFDEAAENAQPNLQESCPACGADGGEPCRPHCLGEAEAQRRAEDGEPFITISPAERGPNAR